MTNKQRKTMIEQWATQINPKAILRAADARCGARYAVYVVEKPGEFGTRCTDYLPHRAAGAIPSWGILCQRV